MKKFEVDYDIELKDLRSINKQKNYIKLFVIDICIVIFLLIVLLPPDPLTLEEYVIGCLFCVIVVNFIVSIVEIIKTSIIYKKTNFKCKLIFNDKTLEQIKDEETRIINYSSINKIKEKIDCLLIFIDKNTVFKIKKEILTDEEIEFIKKIDVNKKNLLKKDVKLINKEDKKYNKIRIFMILLFVLTILSLWIGIITTTYITITKGETINSIFKYMWIMYLFLPIPLISIILGFKYKKLGIKCTKNIVAGFIISFLLIIYGSMSIIDKSMKIGEPFNPEIYESIIKYDLPKNGVFQKIEWSSSYLDNHISNLLEFENNEELNNFNNFIKNSDNWILCDDISSSLEIFLTPLKNKQIKNCYYSIYIKELDEYNKLPEESGIYSIVSMKYNLNNSKLQIEEFKYNYRK